MMSFSRRKFASDLGGDQSCRFGLSHFDREALGQNEFHFGEQFLAHLGPRGVVKPVEEIAASGGFTQGRVGIETKAGKELLALAHRFQPLAFPGTENQRARCFPRGPFRQRDGRRGGGAAPVGRRRGVVLKAASKPPPPHCKKKGRKPSPPHLPPAFHRSPPYHR